MAYLWKKKKSLSSSVYIGYLWDVHGIQKHYLPLDKEVEGEYLL